MLVVAHNVGRVPPNTARVIIRTGHGRVHLLVKTSITQKCSVEGPAAVAEGVRRHRSPAEPAGQRLTSRTILHGAWIGALRSRRTFPLKVEPTLMLMRTSLFVLAGLLHGDAEAQVTVPQASPAELQRCLLRTPLDTWTALKLSPDQLRRMGYVQDACREECEATGATKPEGSITSADGSTVLSEVLNILSEEQYAGWVATCVAEP